MNADGDVCGGGEDEDEDDDGDGDDDDSDADDDNGGDGWHQVGDGVGDAAAPSCVPPKWL